MTFYTFMMRNYKGRDTPEGDLAYDMERDKEWFPKNGKCKFNVWHRLIREHLENRNACDGCLETFESCWKEYELYEKRAGKEKLTRAVNGRSGIRYEEESGTNAD